MAILVASWSLGNLPQNGGLNTSQYFYIAYDSFELELVGLCNLLRNWPRIQIRTVNLNPGVIYWWSAPNLRAVWYRQRLQSNVLMRFFCLNFEIF
jgi:hypothetical protein